MESVHFIFTNVRKYSAKVKWRSLERFENDARGDTGAEDGHGIVRSLGRDTPPVFV